MATIDELAESVAELGRRVDHAEAILEIQALKARYGDLVDQRFAGGRPVDHDALQRAAQAAADLFSPDGVWDGGPGLGRQVGRAAIASRLASPTLSFSRHLFVKPRIEVDGERAQGRWDLLSPCQRSDGSSWWMCGFEDDEYVRVDGIWLHQSMRLTTVFMTRVEPGWEKILA
jgi:SnoaL-like domain